ncbi:MAG: hypothetical protein CSA33_04915 [Desulfobulbus propionicus]|nr:MAG: hypothetical protein CSA33_04915 [Desulfobulbus propionicus]
MDRSVNPHPDFLSAQVVAGSVGFAVSSYVGLRGAKIPPKGALPGLAWGDHLVDMSELLMEITSNSFDHCFSNKR